MLTQAQADRFWSKVDKTAGPSACWPWKASRNEDGYGWFGRRGAHRVALALHLGRALTACALHDCDHPWCCNPAHLHEGTKADNAHEMTVRGRGRVGERNGRAVLTEAAVKSIRERWRPYARGPNTQTKLAAEFGITQAMVSAVIRGANWV
jgi:hypothetical protein